MKEQYRILRSDDVSALSGMQADFLSRNPGWKIAFRRFFLSDKSQIKLLPQAEGAVSYIVQPPLDGRGAGVLLYLVKDAEVSVNGGTTIVRDGSTEHFWSASMVSSAADSERQTDELLEKYEDFLSREGMTLEANCVRTWFFVDDIDNNYAGMVKARRENFLTQGLTPQTHYIASTGIQGAPLCPGSLVQLDSYALKGRFSQKYLYALTHLNRTIEYGVTFERGVSVDYSGYDHLLISGTASIDNKGNVLHKGDVLAQADRMFENIEALLAEGGAEFGDIKVAITYIRNASDAAAIAPVLDRRFGDIPHILTLAPVCRPDWLIETECIAMKQKYLIFDMGGVLMEHNIPACIARAKEILGENFSILGLEGNGEGTGLMEKFEKGLVSAGEFVDTILEYSRPGTTAEDIVQAWNLMHAGIPEARIQKLRQLKAEGYKLYLLSNCNAIHWKDICDNYDMDGIFDDVFISFKEHCSKPEERIYRIVEQRLGVSGSALVFIDDLAANREAARKLGWTTLASMDEL